MRGVITGRKSRIVEQKTPTSLEEVTHPRFSLPPSQLPFLAFQQGVILFPAECV